MIRDAQKGAMSCTTNIKDSSVKTIRWLGVMMISSKDTMSGLIWLWKLQK